MENIYLSENNILTSSGFENPGKDCYVVYNWIWNGELSREETDRQLAEFCSLGIKAFAIIPEPKEFRPTSMPTFLNYDYLSKPYFEEYAYTVKRAKELGMTVVLYDEGGWPSGGACGKVMLEHPEYARRSLAKREISLCKGETYVKSSGTLASYIDDKEISDGYCADKNSTVTEYFEDASCFTNPGNPEIPDVTRRETTDCFIKLTHEGYKPYLEEYFGNTVTAVFTDEPKGPSVPFREELENAFLEKYGYSIRPYLQTLLDGKELSGKEAKVKIDWYELCSEFLCRNFILPQKEWSNKHGMLYTGHMDGDHSAVCGYARYGYYNLMRALRCFDIPGVDAIWRQIYPECKLGGRDVTDCNNGIFPRYASSAATQVGSRRSLTESFGVYGAGTTFNDMRYVLNYQAVRGVNVFNVFALAYRRCGFNMVGEMPTFHKDQACYRDLSYFNSFAERLTYLVSVGERVADVGYYIPVNDFIAEGDGGDTAHNFERIGNMLEDENILFDIIDDDVIKASAESAGSGIISMGKGRYSTVIIPFCRFLPEGCADILNTFSKNGGRVIVISDTAVAGLANAEYSNTVKGQILPVLELTGETEKIRLGVRCAENGKLYILFNENPKEKTFCVNSDKAFARLYAENGKITKFTDGKITLKSGEAAFLFDGELQGKAEEKYSSEISLCGDWYLKRLDRFIIGEMNFETEHFDEAYIKAETGDFTEIYGKGYSGSVMYKTTFKAPKKDGTVLLDLGEVFCSCEVFINGKSFGVLAMSPYALEINAGELNEENILEIRVSNTPANEYEYTTSFDKWQMWQLSTYYTTQKKFHKDSLCGGLLGGVTLKY